MHTITTVQDQPPRHFEAQELGGDLGTDAFLAGYTDAQLSEVALAHHTAAETAMLECCADVLEFCRRVGPTRVNRGQALRVYQQLTGRSQWQVYQMFLVGRFYTPERKALYPTVTYEHLASAIRLTHRDGETEAERADRIERVVSEAADADLNIPKTRALAQSIDREPPPAGTRGEYLEIGDHEVTPPIAETEPPPLVVKSGPAPVERFRKQLVSAYAEWQPGTAYLVAEMVLDVLQRGGWEVREAAL